MTAMDALYKKGWLRREPAGREYRYSVVATREQHAAQLMREDLCEAGDQLLALTHFVGRITLEEAAMLRKVLTAYKGQIDDDHRAARRVRRRPGGRRTAHPGPCPLAEPRAAVGHPGLAGQVGGDMRSGAHGCAARVHGDYRGRVLVTSSNPTRGKPRTTTRPVLSNMGDKHIVTVHRARFGGRGDARRVRWIAARSGGLASGESSS